MMDDAEMLMQVMQQLNRDGCRYTGHERAWPAQNNEYYTFWTAEESYQSNMLG
jgi:hypothetical protein